MHSHQAYTFCVHSDIALPELLPGEGPPDIVVRRRRPSKLASVDGNWGSCLTGTAPNLLHFMIRDGKEIAVAPFPSVDEDAAGGDVVEGKIRELVLGMLMAGLLRQRGLLVLHACCVARDGQAIAFVGDSGWGKSTLADLFHRRGYAVLNDDVLAIDTTAQQPVALPGYPQIKLRPDACAGRNIEALPELYDGSHKRIRKVQDGFPDGPLPLANVYLLEGIAAGRHEIRPLPLHQAFLELTYHTRMTHWLTDPAFKKQHFRQCRALLQAVPVARLKRKKTVSELAGIEQLVAEDLGWSATQPAAQQAVSSMAHAG